MNYFFIILIIIAASLIKGITGFGFALVALPPLMIWYSPIEIIPVLLLCNLFVSIFNVIHKNERILINNHFRQLIIFGAIFTIIGVLVLKYLPEEFMVRVLSIFLIILSLLSIFGVKIPFKFSDSSYKIVGAILGFITGSVSISGPPLALFLHSAKVTNQQFREIFSWFSIVTSIVAISGYIILGMLTFQLVKVALLFIPILFLGSFIGKKINSKIPIPIFEKSILFITLFSSIMILIK